MFGNVRTALEHPSTVPLVLVALLVLAVFWTLNAVATERRAREPRFSDNKPLNALGWFGILLSPFGAVILVAVIWELLALAWSYPDLGTARENASDIRWHGSIMLAMLAMLAALGALFTLLFAYIRVFTTERQTKAAEAQAVATQEALFNEKINAAATDLHARRQITIELDKDTRAEQHEPYERYKDTWQDDIIRRAAAIDRLEGLVEESPESAPRIARLLSVYLREMSRIITPDNREHPRADMEKAAQTLGRLKRIASVDPDTVEIDLRGANLAAFDLSGLCFNGAQMGIARMDGAYLVRAQMQGADLIGAQMQGADLKEAQMQEAFFYNANLQRADLKSAQMQRAKFHEASMERADLRGAQMQDADFQKAKLQMADLRSAQLQRANLRMANMQNAQFNATSMQDSKLWRTKMQGADLRDAHMPRTFLHMTQLDETTKLSGAFLKGAAMKSVDFAKARLSQDQVDSAFGDLTVRLPETITRPPHWSDTDEDAWDGFDERWKEWRRQEGLDSDDPET